MKFRSLPLILTIALSLSFSTFRSVAQNTGTISYQGHVQVGGQPFNGVGQFKFALVSPPADTARRAIGKPNVSGGSVTGVVITDPGAGYLSAPSVVFSDEMGIGARATAELERGSVSAVIIQNGGREYSGGTTVRFSAPPPRVEVQSFWSNDGTSFKGSMPSAPVHIDVEGGLFTIHLGDTSIPGMTESVSPDIFAGGPINLRIWFNDGVNGWELLSPDQVVGSAASALVAEQVRSNSIGAEALMPMSVTTSSLADGSVAGPKIAELAVGETHLEDGAVTGVKLADGSVTEAKLGFQSVSNTRLAPSSVTSSRIFDGTIQLVDLHASLTNTFWKTSGNAGTPQSSFIGTTDARSLDFKVDNRLALRLEPDLNGPRIIGGFGAISPSARSAVISGGGTLTQPNEIDANYGSISGGFGNQVDGIGSTIGGGGENSIGSSSVKASIAGGSENNVGDISNASFAAVAGGLGNTNRGRYSAIGGGIRNIIGSDSESSVIGGGWRNSITPSSRYSVIPGGRENSVDAFYSFAAGRRAKALHPGTFVWADDTDADFASSSNDQFLIRAGGGVGIGTSVPGAHLHVRGEGGAHLFLQETDAASDQFVRQRFKQGANLYWEMAVGGSSNVFQFNNFRNGNVMTLDENGELFVNVLTILGGADLAEPFPMDEKNIPKGSLVVIDENDPGRLKLSESAYDSRVAGIVSGANGVKPGLTLRQDGVMEGNQHVALSGRVYALADAAYGAIKPGDLLTTSDTPGHAMAASDPSRTHGTLVGKAMSSLTEGKGMVLVLVSLH